MDAFRVVVDESTPLWARYALAGLPSGRRMSEAAPRTLILVSCRCILRARLTGQLAA